MAIVFFEIGAINVSKSSSSSRDLTNGSIVRQIIIFAIPILLGQVLQNLYNTVDSVVIGNFVGVTALAAITASADISPMIIGFFTGFSAGAGVVFSKYFGAKDFVTLHRAIHTALVFAVLLGAVMALLGILTTPTLLTLVNCPPDVRVEAIIYLRIYLIGVFLTAVYNVASGVLRAVGDSKNPFRYLSVSCITNIVLDLVFVVGLKMGVEGVAIATIVSQLLSCALILHRMYRSEDVYKLVPKDLKIDVRLLADIVRLGIPAALQTCLTAFSNLFIQRYQNGFGAAAMAGAGAAKKIDKYVGLVGHSIGLSISMFVGQNVGAGKIQRAFKGVRVAAIMSFVVIAFVGVPIYFFAETCLRLFTDDIQAIQYGALLVHIMIPFYYAQSLNMVYSNAVRGFGKSYITLITSTCGTIVCRQIFLAVAMHFNYSLNNVFFSYPFGWLCAASLSVGYYMFAIRVPYYRGKLPME